jgi:NAD-dependent SIR2 family protein deacetylase
VSFGELARFIERAERLLIITGAGCSAPSGIDTYRDDAGDWQRPAPVMHQDFLRSPSIRRRYWARSMRGWPAFRDAAPNAAHHALAALEVSGRVRALVTQNVDGLHQQAGQSQVIELHGSLARVVCLSCRRTRPRGELQQWLEAHNGRWLDDAVTLRPDGDAAFPAERVFDGFQVPGCDCGGLLKPDVVFYGDSVPKTRVRAVRNHLAAADALLVVGSSLMVYSSFRFVREARERLLPMAAINRGRTRADDWFACKWPEDSAVAAAALARRTMKIDGSSESQRGTLPAIPAGAGVDVVAGNRRGSAELPGIRGGK